MNKCVQTVLTLENVYGCVVLSRTKFRLRWAASKAGWTLADHIQLNEEEDASKAVKLLAGSTKHEQDNNEETMEEDEVLKILLINDHKQKIPQYLLSREHL